MIDRMPKLYLISYGQNAFLENQNTCYTTLFFMDVKLGNLQQV